MAPARIAVLGAGSWGTALAIQWARAGGGGVRLWARAGAQRSALQVDRCNRRYLPDAPFPDSLQVAPDLRSALAGVADVLVAVPSHGLRELLLEIRGLLGAGQRLCWATKGFEISTGKLPHEVAREVLGSERLTAVLSGPTFAREVGAGLPTAMTIASRDADYAAQLAGDVSTPSFRAYTSTDIIGVEVGGAVKNVLAIGAGLSDGLGFGANSRIALITRGLMDMTRLGEALGARRETFMGLAGLGDLVLTCTDDQSRNRRFGLLLAQGLSSDAALARIGQVVEGYLAARVVSSVAARAGVVLPVCSGIHDVLYEGLPATQVVAGMMGRAIEAEFG
jgi:glycerol-3-phosphate dehydrogenase (NAD(P)+)